MVTSWSLHLCAITLCGSCYVWITPSGSPILSFNLSYIFMDDNKVTRQWATFMLVWTKNQKPFLCCQCALIVCTVACAIVVICARYLSSDIWRLRYLGEVVLKYVTQPLMLSSYYSVSLAHSVEKIVQPVPLLASHDFLKKSFFGIFFFTLLLLCDELQSGSVSHSSQLLSQSAYCTWRILCNLHTVWMPIILQHSQRATGPEKNT